MHTAEQKYVSDKQNKLSDDFRTVAVLNLLLFFIGDNLLILPELTFHELTDIILRSERISAVRSETSVVKYTPRCVPVIYAKQIQSLY